METDSKNVLKSYTLCCTVPVNTQQVPIVPYNVVCYCYSSAKSAVDCENGADGDDDAVQLERHARPALAAALGAQLVAAFAAAALDVAVVVVVVAAPFSDYTHTLERHHTVAAALVH